MSLSINTNVEAYTTQLNLVNTGEETSAVTEQLSTAAAATTASDDSAELSVSDKLQAQTGGLDQAQSNAQDAISLVQTGEGALADVQSMLQQVRNLAVEFNSGGLSGSAQATITAEVAQICVEIADIGSGTQYNGIDLLTGGATITFQVGGGEGQAIGLTGPQLFGSGASSDVDPAIFSFSGKVNLASIDAAISNVSVSRERFGAVQDRVDHAVASLGTFEENLQAASSSINDVDMASQLTQSTKLQVLNQSGVAVLAQANATPAAVLKMLE